MAQRLYEQSLRVCRYGNGKVRNPVSAELFIALMLRVFGHLAGGQQRRGASHAL